MDWPAIKKEYITDESTSYRKLAEKYGVSYQTICARSKKEGWIEERERFLNKTLTRTLEATSIEQVRRATRIATVADKLLAKIEEAVYSFDMGEVLKDKQCLKQLTGAIKDLKDIQGIKSEADMREQEARIDKLRREAQAEDAGPAEIRVTFGAGDGEGEWAK